MPRANFPRHPADVYLCIMRIVAAAALIALWTVPALAQRPYRALPPDAMIQRYCMAPQFSGGPEFDQVESIAQHFAVVDPRIQDPCIRFALTGSPRFDAWEVEVSANTSLICIPIALVHFMGNSEGELAFIIAHEFGHALDDRCKSLNGRAQAADRSASGSVLATLFGHGSGDGSADQRACESRADELGLRLMTRAGYDPQDAVAALRSLGNDSGDHGAGPFARLAALRKDHPIMADRIRHLRKLIAGQSKGLLP